MINGDFDFGTGLMYAMNSKVKIIHLSLYTTRRDYRAPYQRTFEIHATAGTVNRFQNIINQRGKNSQMAAHAVSNFIPEIVSLQQMPTGQAGIPNGWDTERFRFVLVTEADTMEGTKRISYIQGFTEFSDTTRSGLIDPNMVFYVNSITNVTQTYDRVNNRIFTVPSSTFNVVTDMFGYGKYNQVDVFDLPKLVRPKDVVENAMSINMHDQERGRVINASGSLGTNTATASNRTNGDPLQYFSKLYNSFVEGKSLSAGSAADEIDILQNAADVYGIMESELMAQPFMQALHKVTGEISPSSFTMNVLLMIDPNVVNLPPQVFFRDEIPINLGSQASFGDMMESGDTADTLNPTAENLKAVMICNSVNSFMLENLITRLSVSMSNMAGTNIVIVSDTNSFIPELDLVFWTNKLRARLENILMPKITDGGLTMIDCHVITDTMKDTTIAISVNNGPQYLYRFPTYADSLYTPVVTNTENKAMLTEGFTTLCDVSYIN